MHAVETQGAPPRPGPGQVSVNCSRWELYEAGGAFGREWVIRGLADQDDITTIEVTVSRDSIVTIVAEPGVPAGTPNVTAQLTVDGQPDTPFVVLQHCPIPDRDGATAFAPVDLDGLKTLLEALYQGAPMKLTILAGGSEVLQAPLYNDPSFRDVFQRIAA